MKVDLVGKIKNTQLPRSKALFPMFEAVVNSFQAIEDASESGLSPSIHVVVNRDSALPGMDGDVDGFTVTDNGVGFNEVNLDAFFTSDTQYKLRRGGKGLGRFIWLKAFEHAEIESHYRDNGKLLKRSFKFTTNGEQPTAPATESKETKPKTTIRLMTMRPRYKENCPRDLAVIGHRLIEHCLPFFLDQKCPAVIISDNNDSKNLNQYFRENFRGKRSKVQKVSQLF